jgi:glycosyltransferase involved in cell wall biosynthesis
MLCRFLRDIGHDVVVFATAEDPPPAFRSLSVEGFPYHYRTALNQALRDRAGEFDSFDVVHSYLPASIPGVNAIAERGETSTVVSLNAYNGICPKNNLRYNGHSTCERNGVARCLKCAWNSTEETSESRLRWLISIGGNARMIDSQPPERLAIDRYQALSSHVKSTYTGFGFPGDRIQVVPNAVDGRFDVTHRSDFEPPYRLLYVGYLHKHKGVLLLPQVVERLREELRFDVSLSIVGHGPVREQLEESVDGTEAIDIVGHVPNEELPEVYASHDLFVYPGQWQEPFGRVFLEALATGTPIVATDVGATAEIISAAGRTVSPTVEGVTSGIVEVLSNGCLRDLHDATDSALEPYRPDRVKASLAEMYRELCGE